MLIWLVICSVICYEHVCNILPFLRFYFHFLEFWEEHRGIIVRTVNIHVFYLSNLWKIIKGDIYIQMMQINSSFWLFLNSLHDGNIYFSVRSLENQEIANAALTGMKHAQCRNPNFKSSTSKIHDFWFGWQTSLHWLICDSMSYGAYLVPV